MSSKRQGVPGTVYKSVIARRSGEYAHPVFVMICFDITCRQHHSSQMNIQASRTMWDKTKHMLESLTVEEIHEAPIGMTKTA
jgi:hypothetical protein